MRHRNPEIMNKIIAFVDEYYQENGHSPSTSEIGSFIGLSRSTAHRYLQEMNEKQMITYDGKFIETLFTGKASVGSRINASVLNNSVSCGAPLLEEENINEYVSLPESVFGSGEFMLLTANGDSMIGAGIDEEDTVVVRKQNTAEEGQIVVALVNGMNTLKTFYRDRKHNKVVLHPENEKYEDIIADDCVIQGVAVNIIKPINKREQLL